MEEEILLLAIWYPSVAIRETLSRFPWREDRCRQAWEILGTSTASTSLKLADLLPQLSEDLHNWLTPLAMEPREYKDPLEMLKKFLESCFSIQQQLV